jgi:PIN domain nuclease of toxin-antitoxin system
VRRLIERNAAEHPVFVSSVSAWEVAMLAKKGRLRLTMSAEDWITKCEALPNLRFVAVDHRIFVRSVSLPEPLHRDPADRIIVATTLHLGAKLVTRDDMLRSYRHVETAW